ncbi:MAG TPA: hypothetical protein PKV44_04680 [Bacillota bacterium]|nr:hypothetical protein [Bacillota bacterium]
MDPLAFWLTVGFCILPLFITGACFIIVPWVRFYRAIENYTKVDGVVVSLLPKTIRRSKLDDIPKNVVKPVWEFEIHGEKHRYEQKSSSRCVIGEKREIYVCAQNPTIVYVPHKKERRIFNGIGLGLVVLSIYLIYLCAIT